MCYIDFIIGWFIAHTSMVCHDDKSSSLQVFTLFSNLHCLHARIISGGLQLYETWRSR